MASKILGIIFIVAIILFPILLGRGVADSPETGMAILVNVVVVAICSWFVLRNKTDRRFLIRLFAVALCARYIVGLAIYFNNMQVFFGADAQTYDFFGEMVYKSWVGLIDPNEPFLSRYTSVNRSGWGMYYFVAAIYYVLGRNPLAVQLICAALGAVTCVAVYNICALIHPERRVARTAAVLIALSPSMILWSSQLLKDSPIVLALCLCSIYALKLRDNINVSNLLLLFLSLFCLYALRHYAAYILFVAIAGSLILGAKKYSPGRLLQGSFLIIVIGLAFAYFGAGDVVQSELDLERIQAGRVWSARVAESGFGGDVDITDPQAAITFLPVGLLYVLFAPFPWMITNLRQAITLPELVVWWALTPAMVKGFYSAFRYRLRETFVICIFTAGLTIVYALYQSNVGTAYRHRAQLYVFFCIFISIGLELRRAAKREKRAHLPHQPIGIAPTAISPVQNPIDHRLNKDAYNPPG